MRIVSISDTHGMHRKMQKPPKGDVLICAGDHTGRGTLDEWQAFDGWLGEQPHQHKIVIAGNHDWCCESDRESSVDLLTNAIYLVEESSR